MYTIKQNLVAQDIYSIKCPYSMTAEFIVVHNTANDATAENEVAYMIGNKNQVSFHYAVDDQEVVPIPTTGLHIRLGHGQEGISIDLFLPAHTGYPISFSISRSGTALSAAGPMSVNPLRR